ncbi:MAG TPA: type II secretion system protein GspG [Gemmataceae bacterium]|nr:type II secretion system protein GspG [Gemmataceae bacterium]
MKSSNVKTLLLLVLLFAASGLVIWFGYKAILNERHKGTARSDVAAIDRAATAYHSKHSEWPSQLDVLIAGSENDNPFCGPDPLTDPWGRRYQYDPKQVHPSSGKPLIWTEGLEPGKSAKISNWD